MMVHANERTVAPATGTPETGGWSTRELRTILRGLEGINLIAADIVEVAPAYDTNAEHTTMAAADALYEIMSLMVKKGPLSMMIESQDEDEAGFNAKLEV
jgi:agmatinase